MVQAGNTVFIEDLGSETNVNLSRDNHLKVTFPEGLAIQNASIIPVISLNGQERLQ